MEKKKGQKVAKHRGNQPQVDKRALFVREYLIDRNATQAAIRAGYSPKSARVTGHRLLTDAAIAAQVAETTAATFDRLAVTKERITEELARVAFSDMGEFVKWGMRTVYTRDKSGAVHEHEAARVEIVESSELHPEARRVISEIAEGRDGLKIKLHDKMGALRLLGLELGMFKEKGPDGSAENPFHHIIEAVQRAAAPLPVQEPNAGRQVAAPATATTPAPSSATPAPRTISPLLRPGGA